MDWVSAGVEDKQRPQTHSRILGAMPGSRYHSFLHSDEAELSHKDPGMVLRNVTVLRGPKGVLMWSVAAGSEKKKNPAGANGCLVLIINNKDGDLPGKGTYYQQGKSSNMSAIFCGCINGTAA